MEESTISDLRETELNHIAMTEAIVNLLGRLKRMGDHCTSTRVNLQTRSKELQTREEEIGRREKVLEEKESSFESKEAELEQIEEAITEKLLEFEQGKRELESLNLLINEKERKVLEVEELIREKERECGFVENRIEKGNRNLARVEKCIKEIELKVELKEREFEEVLLEKLRLKEELLEPNIDELHVIANNVGECINEARRKESEVVSKFKEVELAEMRVDECRNEVQRKEREVESKERRVLERFKKVELKEEHLCSMEKLIEENKRGLDLLMKTSEERGKQLEEHERNLALVSDEIKRKERELQQQAEALELKRAQCGSQVMIQQPEIMPGANNAAVHYNSSVTNSISSLVKAKEPEYSLSKNAASLLSSNLQPIATTDERYNPGYLNENLSGNNFIQNELAASLRLVPDPAKLVLNNMKNSLAQYLKNGYFEEHIMLGNLSILRELMSMSPDVGSHPQVDATFLAAEWKLKMIGSTENSLESLAFLLFLATFGIVYIMLNADEIVKLLGLISQNKRALDLCQTPVFAVKIAGTSPIQFDGPFSFGVHITDLVRNLIEKKRLFEAVTCICMFKLNDQLSLVPVLEEYVRDAIKCFEATYGLSITPEEKIELVNKQIADARALVQCVKDYNLQSEYPSNAIKIQIVQLETLEEYWRLSVRSLCPSIDGQHDHTRKKKKRNNSTSDPEFQPQQQRKITFVCRGTRP